MKKITKCALTVCLIGVAVLAALLWRVEGPGPASYDGDNTSMYAPILYPQVDGGKYTLSQLEILEVYPDNYWATVRDDFCIIFRAKVIKDLHDVLNPGAIVFVVLYPSPGHDGEIGDILAAGKEHLADIDSCFVYGTPVDAEDTCTYYTDRGEPFADTGGVVILPDVDDGGILPILNDAVDTKALETIWKFPIDTYDSSLSKVKNMEDLLAFLEARTDPDYLKKQEKLVREKQIKEDEMAVMKHLALTMVVVVATGLVLTRLCRAENGKSSHSKGEKYD